jgi:hypothetical protein
LENFDRFIPIKIFLTKEVKEVKKNYDIPDGLKGVDKSVLLKLLNKDNMDFEAFIDTIDKKEIINVIYLHYYKNN